MSNTVSKDDKPLRRPREQVLEAVREITRAFCSCGSGAHPRHCDLHPRRHQMHVDELEADDRLLRAEELLKQWIEHGDPNTDPTDNPLADTREFFNK